MKKEIRLQKYLADMGIASRRKAEQYMQSGLVKVNGQVVTELGTKVDPDKDEVHFQDTLVAGKPKPVVIMLNKPIGYTCTTRLFSGEKNVLSLVNLPIRLYPVGRLDKETEGLLLLTNDGQLANELTHPKFSKEKEYIVEVEQVVPEEFLANVRLGVDLVEYKTRPAKINQLSPKSFSIILQEGRNRQIRKLCAKFGVNIRSLQRIRVNGLELGSLQLGEFKKLSPADIKKLK